MKKLIMTLAALLVAASSFANGTVNGPFLKDDGVKFTTQSVGLQVQDQKLFVNYANDGKKDWFTVSNPGSVVPNIENYAGGLFKGTRFVTVLATNAKESRVSYGLEKQVLSGRLPLVHVPVTVIGQVFPSGFGGGSLTSLSLSNSWSWGVRVGLKL